MTTKRMLAAAVLGAMVLVGCHGGGGVPKAGPALTVEAPPAPREFRAAWVATVGNIDWPTKPGLSTDDQKREAVAILDRLKELNMNAAILQVRTSADALYDSKLEPWSYYLTGTQGKAPDPYYDPLKFWVDEAHKRGIELHAWFNPFRAKQGGAKFEFASSHIVKTNPELVHQYGNMWWMDPAEPAARQRSLDVFLDVVKRYDVDGIHIDDYFYPYPEANRETKKEIPFPDDAAWGRYQKAGGKLSREDWRREAISEMIHDIYVGTKKLKPWVKFGISPFGLPYGETMPEGIKGFNQYEKLYADTILWLNNGWCDYWTPQLYWPTEQRPQSYPILLDYWATHNPMHRHLYPGLFTSRVRDGEGGRVWSATELGNQIELTRWRPGSQGHVHFSMKALMGDRAGLTERLKEKFYGEPALVPASPWLGGKAPAKPVANAAAENGGMQVSWSAAKAGDVATWAVWIRNGERWTFHTFAADVTEQLLRDDEKAGPVTEVVVSGVDRVGNESARVTLQRPKEMKYPWPGLTTRPAAGTK